MRKGGEERSSEEEEEGKIEGITEIGNREERVRIINRVGRKKK